jgi:hypothetical protein
VPVEAMTERVYFGFLQEPDETGGLTHCLKNVCLLREGLL